MGCLLVTPKEELLFNKAISQTRTLRFHKLSKLLKNKFRGLMAKFLEFFRKKDLTGKSLFVQLEEYNSLIYGLGTSTNTMLNSTASIRKIDWSTETTKKACEEVECECADDYKEEYYDEDCDCEDCCAYREDNNLEYEESEYSVIISEPIPKQLQEVSSRRRGRSSAIKEEGKPSEPKKWYEKGAIVLPF